MFAIFLHESMDPFHQTVTSFPTVIFSFILIIAVLYWAVAALGLIELDIIDFDMDGDVDINDSAELQAGMAGLLLRLGLNSVPFTVVITIFGLIGWVLSYFICLFGLNVIPDFFLFELLFKLAIFVGVSIFSVFATAIIIKPMRSFFKNMDVDETKHIVGQLVVIRSSIANNSMGEALLNDGGADLLLNVRTTGDDVFKKNDEVVVIEHNKTQNVYRVISKSEFRDDL